MNPQPRSSFVALPGAIIIAGAIIGIAIIWSRKPLPAPVATAGQVAAAGQHEQADISIAPVTATDHILGNPNADIKIVEYSDPSCPFCKMFHPTMQKIMAEYGAGGKVAWVYRHFPIDKEGTRSDGGILHPNAGHEAQALECAGSLGGNDKFWAYTNRLYEITPSVTPQTPDGLDQKELPNIAKYVGLDPVSFNECLTSGQFKDKIEKQYMEGLNAGIIGTPYSVIITASGKKVPINGALPYENVKAAIDTLLSATD